MYKPTMTNVPMFSKKGEIQASVSQEDLQLAYSAGKHVGLTLNGQYLNRRPLSLDDGKTSDYKVRNTCIDGAVGLYRAGEKSSFDFFVGFGKGYASISYYEDRYLSGGSSHFNKVYFQPDLVLGMHRTLQMAFSIRVTVAHFKNLPMDTYPQSSPAIWPAFFEPSFTLRQKLGVFGLLGQVQYSSAPDQDDVYYGHFKPFQDRLLLRLALQIQVDKIISEGLHF
jgi:hypothetical protein